MSQGSECQSDGSSLLDGDRNNEEPMCVDSTSESSSDNDIVESDGGSGNFEEVDDTLYTVPFVVGNTGCDAEAEAQVEAEIEVEAEAAEAEWAEVVAAFWRGDLDNDVKNNKLKGPLHENSSACLLRYCLDALYLYVGGLSKTAMDAHLWNTREYFLPKPNTAPPSLYTLLSLLQVDKNQLHADNEYHVCGAGCAHVFPYMPSNQWRSHHRACPGCEYCQCAVCQEQTRFEQSASGKTRPRAWGIYYGIAASFAASYDRRPSYRAMFGSFDRKAKVEFHEVGAVPDVHQFPYFRCVIRPSTGPSTAHMVMPWSSNAVRRCEPRRLANLRPRCCLF